MILLRLCYWLLTLKLIGIFLFVNARYEIIPDRVETALGENDKLCSLESLRIKKFNRTTFVVTGEFTVKIDIDDKVTLKVFLLNFQGNQYKLMITKDLGKFCETLYEDQYEKLFVDVHNQTRIKVPWKTCPYPKGSNEVKDYLIEDKDGLIPPYIPGSEKWQIQMRFYKNEEMLGGFNAFGILRNEQSLLAGG